jgi:hypothetical protein
LKAPGGHSTNWAKWNKNAALTAYSPEGVPCAKRVQAINKEAPVASVRFRNGPRSVHLAWPRVRNFREFVTRRIVPIRFKDSRCDQNCQVILAKALRLTHDELTLCNSSLNSAWWSVSKF